MCHVIEIFLNRIAKSDFVSFPAESIFSAIFVEKKSRDWNGVKKVRRINVEPSALLKNEYSERTRTNSKSEDWAVEICEGKSLFMRVIRTVIRGTTKGKECFADEGWFIDHRDTYLKTDIRGWMGKGNLSYMVNVLQRHEIKISVPYFSQIFSRSLIIINILIIIIFNNYTFILY